MLKRVRISGEFMDNVIVRLVVMRDYHIGVLWSMEAGGTIDDEHDEVVPCFGFFHSHFNENNPKFKPIMKEECVVTGNN